MSDRLAVMNRGRLEQLGSPRDVYEEPETAFVADFLGISNLLRGVAEGTGEVVELGQFKLTVPRSTGSGTGGEVRLFVRPERVQLQPHAQTGANRIPAMVERVVYGGASSQVFVRLPDGQQIQALVQNTEDREQYASGDPITVRFPPEALRLLAGTGSEPEKAPETSGTQEEAGAAITP